MLCLSVHLAALITLTAAAADLTSDAIPTAASPGPDDGGGNWGAALNNTNWWNGSANVVWNNASIAVLGVNTANAVTVTITNNVTAGGLIYSNMGTGIYTIGVANSALLALSGSPVIQFSGPGGTHVINPSLSATGGLSILTATANNGILCRPAAASNDLAGTLAIGTPGNASYATPTALYVDFNNATLANVLNHTTNIIIYSNATLRISGQNGSAYNLAFPRRITLSGDGQGGTRGVWLITGNAGGVINADVVLAGSSTIMTSSGGGGAYTYTETGTITGMGDLRLVNDTTYTTLPTLVLSGGPHAYVGTNTIVGGNLIVWLQGGNHRLPTGTILTLGIGTGPAGAAWSGYGQLVLGNAAAAMNQALAGLASPAGTVGCGVFGANSSNSSVLTVSNTSDHAFSGALGGATSPANMLALVKAGAGTLALTGTNLCAGGYTVSGGTLQFGDGATDYPLSGPLTNQAVVVFNSALSQTFSNRIAGTGTLIKGGAGVLALSGTNGYTGGTTVSNGVLLVNGALLGAGGVTVAGGALGGNGVILGPVAVGAGGELAPGVGVGVLTISNQLSLGGTTLMKVNPAAGTNDSVRGLTSVSFGGTLVLSNLGNAYAPGDHFKLFDSAAYSGSFTTIIPAAPGPGNAWDTGNLATNGTLSVVTSTNIDHPPQWMANPVVGPAATQGAPYTGTLAPLAGDPDPGDALTFTKVSGPAWLTLAANGAMSGTPALPDVGTNSFAVRVTDSGGLSSDTTLLIQVFSAAPIQLLSPDGTLTLSFGLSNFDGSVNCPVYSLSRTGQTLVAPSKLGLTFGSGLLRENLGLVSEVFSTNNTVWQPLYGERSSVLDHYNQVLVTLQETVPPNRLLQLAWRAYNEGAAFCYTLPAQPGLAGATNLTEQTEFRFAANYPAWTTTTAQGTYTSTTVSGVPAGCERPLPIQVATNLHAAIGEARLVDYSRMKFAPLSGKTNSLVSVLDSPVNSVLPLTTPWRFVLVGSSPGQLLENDFLVLNLNDPCALTNPSWIQPGKVIREVTLTTTGGLACVDFAVKHRLQYVEFDAGWYGPENATLTATNVNVDPARSPGPLDLARVINYASSNGVGVILYVNWLAMTNELSLLPPLYQSWGVRGIKYGFVSVGAQAWTSIVNEAARLCATNRLMMDVHDEFRPSGYTRTYPNLMTIEGIDGDEGTPSTAQDTTELFARMLAGPADHTVCYFDARVTNNWSHAYQLAKAVCFYSPWQFLYWYDRPTNSYHYVSDGNDMITEVPELEFYDYLPTVWDETRVLQSAIGQYAVIARRSGADWFVGAMNATSNRTFSVPLDFLAAGQDYLASLYSQDPSVPTRTQVRIDRAVVNSTSALTLTLAPSGGEAVRLTPAVPPAVQSSSLAPGLGFSLISSGHLGATYSLRSTANLALPATNWTVLVGTALVSVTPFTNVDVTTTNQPQRFYRYSVP